MIAETQDVCNITQHLFLSPRDPDKLRQLNNNLLCRLGALIRGVRAPKNIQTECKGSCIKHVTVTSTRTEPVERSRCSVSRRSGCGARPEVEGVGSPLVPSPDEPDGTGVAGSAAVDAALLACFFLKMAVISSMAFCLAGLGGSWLPSARVKK